MTTPDTSAVERALAGVARAQAELNELQLALEDRTSELTDQILLLGMDLHEAGGPPADRDLVRRLYWDAPSLSAQAIYEAFGLRSTNDVSAIAGPREFHLPCKDCGIVLTRQVKNRSQLVKLRATNRCEACTTRAAERERQRRAELETQWRRRDREDHEAERRAMEAYVLANPDFPEEPTGVPMYVDIPGTESGSTTVRLRDLSAIRDDLRNRLRDPKVMR
jgi:hypothetical protein